MFYSRPTDREMNLRYAEAQICFKMLSRSPLISCLFQVVAVKIQLNLHHLYVNVCFFAEPCSRYVPVETSLVANGLWSDASTRAGRLIEFKSK